jgi:cell division protein ZapA (FtsZ GTPase activity inhibitor)
VSKRVVAVQISGHEYRIRSEVDEAHLQRVARLVDAAMDQIRSRTGTVDTLDVAVLTSLNLARELLALKERDADSGLGDAARLRGLIELLETGLVGGREEGDRAALLTVPTGDEIDDGDSELLGSLIEGEPAPSEVAPR